MQAAVDCEDGVPTHSVTILMTANELLFLTIVCILFLTIVCVLFLTIVCRHNYRVQVVADCQGTAHSVPTHLSVDRLPEKRDGRAFFEAVTGHGCAARVLRGGEGRGRGRGEERDR